MMRGPWCKGLRLKDALGPIGPVYWAPWALHYGYYMGFMTTSCGYPSGCSTPKYLASCWLDLSLYTVVGHQDGRHIAATSTVCGPGPYLAAAAIQRTATLNKEG